MEIKPVDVFVVRFVVKIQGKTWISHEGIRDVSFGFCGQIQGQAVGKSLCFMGFCAVFAD